MKDWIFLVTLALATSCGRLQELNNRGEPNPILARKEAPLVLKLPDHNSLMQLAAGERCPEAKEYVRLFHTEHLRGTTLSLGECLEDPDNATFSFPFSLHRRSRNLDFLVKVTYEEKIDENKMETRGHRLELLRVLADGSSRAWDIHKEPFILHSRVSHLQSTLKALVETTERRHTENSCRLVGRTFDKSENACLFPKEEVLTVDGFDGSNFVNLPDDSARKAAVEAFITSFANQHLPGIDLVAFPSSGMKFVTMESFDTRRGEMNIHFKKGSDREIVFQLGLWLTPAKGKILSVTPQIRVKIDQPETKEATKSANAKSKNDQDKDSEGPSPEADSAKKAGEPQQSADGFYPWKADHRTLDILHPTMVHFPRTLLEWLNTKKTEGSPYHQPLAAGDRQQNAADLISGKRNHCPGCDLSHLDLYRLARPTLDFSGKNFQGASFFDSNVSSLVFGAGRMQAANFSEAQMLGTFFRKADLEGAAFENARGPRADFTGANLENADFESSDFHGGFFDAASLRGASFAGATLDAAAFKAADLRGVNFRGASMQHADLTDAIIDSETSFADVDTSSVVGMPKR